jgi:hypothetical protein
MMRGPQQMVTGAPYSAVEVVQSQETLSDGNTITHKHQANVYRDSQGRVRTEETITPSAASGKAPYTVATILDFVAGKRYMLDSSTMTAYESPLHIPHTPPSGSSSSGAVAEGRRGGAQANGARPNVVDTDMGTQTVNGVTASGRQHSEVIPAGSIGNTRPIQVTRQMWVSSELKVPMKITSVDARFGTSEMDLTQVVQSEPSATLFVVPAGYTVKTGGPGRPGGPQPRGPRPPAQQQ